MQAPNTSVAYDGTRKPDDNQQPRTNGGDQLQSHVDNRSAWPSNVPSSSFFQQNIGFSTTNTGFHKQRNNYNGFGQPKQSRQQNFVDKHEHLPEIIRTIECNHRVLICMRGAPGSGKSYLAHAIVDRTMNGNYADHIFTTDDFFVNARTNQYRFDRSRLSEAHEWNQANVAKRAANGWSPIIVDNTSMKLWEMVPYFREAVKHGYLIRILEPNTPWRIAVGKLAQRNTHGVDQEQIARMLSNYEPGTVQDVLRSMQIFNYDNPEPKLRNRPDIVEVPRSVYHQRHERQSRFLPKDQRSERYFNQTERSQGFRSAAADVEGVSTTLQELEPFEQEWQPFEQETESFWGTEANQATEQTSTPKPQRKPANETTITNMYKILQDRQPNVPPIATETPASESLKRHKKFCRNENQAFQEMRQICSNIPVAPLWDLFEKCNGDGDWTMDIILNERESMGIETLNTQEEIDRDNFTCDCDRVTAGTSSEQSALAIAAAATESLKSRMMPAQPVRRKQQMGESEHEVRRQVNELFVIPDKHYSQHTRKIRDIRYGAAGATSTTVAADDIDEASGGAENDDGQEESDDIIEMDLGIELVCQLDQQFGSSGFQHEQLQALKTTVFMPKTLGQQLYAIWVESLYNQLEEQRQQSIKDDEEFAKVLHKQEQAVEKVAPPPLSTIKPPLADIADIEIAWETYNTNANEWKRTSPEDLATKLTKDKLFEIFPNVERQQLLHVFSAYSNNFRETVDFFKEELKFDVDNKMLTNGQQLLDHVRLEAETVRNFWNIFFGNSRKSTIFFKIIFDIFKLFEIFLCSDSSIRNGSNKVSFAPHSRKDETGQIGRRGSKACCTQRLRD